MTATPEVQQIIEQVQAELLRMVQEGDTGQVTIHCGRGDLAVEVTRKRKHDPVRIEQERRLPIIGKPR